MGMLQLHRYECWQERLVYQLWVDGLHPLPTVSGITNESRRLNQKNMHVACAEVSD